MAAARAGMPRNGSPIKKVVVLMLENRSFDHLLGQCDIPGLDGIQGDEELPRDTRDPSKGTMKISLSPPFDDVPCDPTHTVDGMREQLFGTVDFEEPGPSPAPNNGHVQQTLRAFGGSEEAARFAFSSFPDGSLPALHSLAKEFTVFDRFFCSFPGRTVPNRMFALSGTSYGEGQEERLQIERVGYPQRTFLSDLEDDGFSWGLFYRQIPFALALSELRPLPRIHDHIHPYDRFESMLAAGELPDFTWIEPRYQSDQKLGDRADDMRPGNKEDIRHGDRFLKRIYDQLRASKYWSETLFIITFDEHGGFWDHVPPPNRNIPLPDDVSKVEDGFARLGGRIPFILASPWVARGRVVHGPQSGEEGEYEHCSVIKTIRSLWGLSRPPLTPREKWSAGFEHVLESEPRTDAPETLPEAPIPYPDKPIAPVATLWAPIGTISRPPKAGEA